MSFLQTTLLGAFSGFTIFLGLPIARLRALSKNSVAFLNAVAIGILFFLFVDIVSAGIEPLGVAIANGEAWGMLLVFFAGGFAVGLLGLVEYGRQILLRRGRDHTATELAVLIAVGIGLHNFSEGLAIGSSAHAGRLSLALLLFVGFALHNVTEAFGIAAPLSGSRVSWKFLIATGFIAGGPNLIGTIVGEVWYSASLAVLFLSTAAGAILYVIGELLAAGRKLEAQSWTGLGLLIGFLSGMTTELILVAIGV
ncbi:ZIP family metal transporter [Candidatus Peregrinibacteria bacterium]|nr:ZIP family metal transporter [Candidatus Peregrinibacteria bacterium]MBI3816168.1 ZIP family metal transporter [Candidatus Peregrinibacteria bacterium]